MVELSGNATTPLPVPVGITPIWLVPTEVGELDASATADQPVNMDFFYNSGEPDVYSAAVGNAASVKVVATQVSPGIWDTDIGQSGPFAGPAPAGTVTVAASAQGQLFDSALTSDTADMWQVGVDPAAQPAMAAAIRANAQKVLAGSAWAPPVSVSPDPTTGLLTLNPGQSGTITVTITPTGAHGSVVRGNLYIDTFDNLTDNGAELIDFPYSYTIK